MAEHHETCDAIEEGGTDTNRCVSAPGIVTCMRHIPDMAGGALRVADRERPEFRFWDVSTTSGQAQQVDTDQHLRGAKRHNLTMSASAYE